MKYLLIILLLSGCAQIQPVLESDKTFIACKAVDVVTTAVALNSGLFHEANPLLAPFIGPHNIFPLIAFSVGVYLLIRYINEPKLTMAANVVTCGVAGRNAALMYGAGVLR